MKERGTDPDNYSELTTAENALATGCMVLLVVSWFTLLGHMETLANDVMTKGAEGLTAESLGKAILITSAMFMELSGLNLMKNSN